LRKAVLRHTFYGHLMVLCRLTGQSVPGDAEFVVADEMGYAKNFHPARLRWITPLLWIAYIFSSMTVFFLATWTPLVSEALHYTRSQAAGGSGAPGRGGIG
jgi:AAHS family 4-hydroxybenzoate transporter-like MFS transporter